MIKGKKKGIANNINYPRIILAFCILLFAGTSMLHAAEFGPGAAKEVRKAKEQVRSKGQSSAWADLYTGARLDLVIPVIDAGLPSDPSTWEKKGVWPELRRAEAVWYSKKLALAIEQTGVFNSVLVVPDTAISSDLYLMGELKKSNGEDLEIELRLFATTGKELLRKWKLKARVSEDWYADPRTQNSDPFEASYKSVANKIVAALVKIAQKDVKVRKRNAKHIAKNKLHRVKPESLEEIKLVRAALFGADLSEEEFSDVLKSKGKKGNKVTSLTYIPDMEQESWRRVNAIISADGKFNRMMDNSYLDLTDNMNDSYQIWQKDAYPIAKAQREAKQAANAALFGAILGAAVAGTLANNSNSTAGKVAAASAAVASVAALSKSFKERKESKQQASQLNELGNSVSAVISPKVISMENREVELIGTASEQQSQWSQLLRELYAEGIQDFEDLDIVAATN